MEPACNVIIVDDELLVRQGIKHLLNWESEGFRIIGEAANGQDALELVMRLKPHIVITDIVMPLMDGVEFTSTLKATHPEIEIIVLSSFGEYDYMRSTFQNGAADYILKPKLDADQLLVILKRIASKIPSLQLNERINEHQLSMTMTLDKLMSGYAMDHNSNEAANMFPHNSYRLFGLDLKYVLNKYNKETVMKLLTNWLDQTSLALKYFPLPTEPHIIVLIFNMNDQNWEALIGNIRTYITSNADLIPQQGWTLGEPFIELNDLYDEFHQRFMKICDYRFFLPTDFALLVVSELPQLEAAEPSFNMNRFTETMQSRRFDEALAQLFTYVKQVSDYYTFDVFSFKSWLGNIIFNITILLGKLEMDTKQLEKTKYNYFRYINEASHIDVAIAQLNAFIEEMKVNVQLNKGTTGNPNMTMILNYIHEHYMESLTLTDIANHFHFNPSYLSSLFSTHNAEGFSEYLNRVRVDKAAELLQCGDSSISDISEQVGYSDHSYFTKVFKKMKGVAPSHYRKTNLSSFSFGDKGVEL